MAQLIHELPRLTEAQLTKQLKMVDDNISLRSLIDWIQRGLIPPPQGRGHGVRRTFAAETAGEIAANRKIFHAGNFTLAQLRMTRELALLIEHAPNLTAENYSYETKRLSDAFAGQEFFLLPVCLWLVEKWNSLMRIYGDRLAITPRIYAFGDPEHLKTLVWQFYTRWFDNYTMNSAGKLVEKPRADKRPKAEEVIEAFASNEPMAAKGRE